MADERKYFVLCGANCKFESMTKEQILTAIEQAISTGKIIDVDTGFVTKVKELNSGKPFQIWLGTQAEYNVQRENIGANVFCIITDDTTADDINAAINALMTATESNTKSIAEVKEDVEAIKTGVTLYEGEAADLVTIPNIDYRAFTRFVAYVKVNGLLADEDREKRITFNIIEDMLDTAGIDKGKYSLTAYATKVIAGKDTNEIDTYKLEIEKEYNANDVSAKFSLIFSGASGFGEEALFVHKLVGYKY